MKYLALFVGVLSVFLLIPSCSGDLEVTEPPPEEVPHPGLFAPALAKEQAPPVFSVRLETTQGEFQVECTREWAPNGVDRFLNLVKVGYLDDVAFYRALKDYIVQFGTFGDPEVTQIWSTSVIGDDPVRVPNERGYLAFAQDASNSRTTQLFINLADNSEELDPAGLAPICRVSEGMEVVDSIFVGYGELHPKGDGPRPNLLQKLGNKYLRREFPEMDYIIRASIVE